VALDQGLPQPAQGLGQGGGRGGEPGQDLQHLLGRPPQRLQVLGGQLLEQQQLRGVVDLLPHPIGSPHDPGVLLQDPDQPVGGRPQPSFPLLHVHRRGGEGEQNRRIVGGGELLFLGSVLFDQRIVGGQEVQIRTPDRYVAGVIEAEADQHRGDGHHRHRLTAGQVCDAVQDAGADASLRRSRLRLGTGFRCHSR